MKRVVLTGGPGGGKSSLMTELRMGDPRAERWLMVPEAAPLLFAAGLDGREKAFQGAVVRLQIALEEACAGAGRPGQVLICHRGTLDPLAYWLRNGWDETEFFDLTELSHEQHLRRYDGVIHLQTAAVGAKEHYRRWPDAHRPETGDQAAQIDMLCAAVWRQHTHFVSIENTGQGWAAKCQVARTALSKLLTR